MEQQQRGEIINTHKKMKNNKRKTHATKSKQKREVNPKVNPTLKVTSTSTSTTKKYENMKILKSKRSERKKKNRNFRSLTFDPGHQAAVIIPT